MNKYGYHYYLSIRIDGHEERIGITYLEHMFLWLLCNDYQANHAASLIGLGDRGDEEYSKKLRERFHVENIHSLTPKFWEAYPHRTNENKRRIEGMAGE